MLFSVSLLSMVTLLLVNAEKNYDLNKMTECACQDKAIENFRAYIANSCITDAQKNEVALVLSRADDGGCKADVVEEDPAGVIIISMKYNANLVSCGVKSAGDTAGSQKTYTESRFSYTVDVDAGDIHDAGDTPQQSSGGRKIRKRELMPFREVMFHVIIRQEKELDCDEKKQIKELLKTSIRKSYWIPITFCMLDVQNIEE